MDRSFQYTSVFLLLFLLASPFTVDAQAESGVFDPAGIVKHAPNIDQWLKQLERTTGYSVQVYYRYLGVSASGAEDKLKSLASEVTGYDLLIYVGFTGETFFTTMYTARKYREYRNTQWMVYVNSSDRFWKQVAPRMGGQDWIDDVVRDMLDVSRKVKDNKVLAYAGKRWGQTQKVVGHIIRDIEKASGVQTSVVPDRTFDIKIPGTGIMVSSWWKIALYMLIALVVIIAIVTLIPEGGGSSSDVRTGTISWKRDFRGRRLWGNCSTCGEQVSPHSYFDTEFETHHCGPEEQDYE